MQSVLDWRRVLRAARYSWQGLTAVTRQEASFRQELAATAVLLPLGLWLGQGGVEKALLAGTLLVVLIVELLNTGIETAINRISPELHPLSGLAKDIGSAAVMLAMLLVAMVWGLLLWPQ